MSTTHDRDREPPPAAEEGHVLGWRIAEELANRGDAQIHGRTSWRHYELAARIRDADRETELEAGS